jgi:hypothetical protein
MVRFHCFKGKKKAYDAGDDGSKDLRPPHDRLGTWW